MIQIRSFKPEDQSSVLNLITSIMSSEFDDDRDAFPVEDLTEISTSYSGNGNTFFVASDGSKIVGTAAIKREDERVALLRRLFVDKEYRKKKVGQRLIDEALSYCKRGGYDEVVFKATSNMQAARQICEKSGFIQRAHLKMGSVELYKMVLHLPRSGKKIHS